MPVPQIIGAIRQCPQRHATLPLAAADRLPSAHFFLFRYHLFAFQPNKITFRESSAVL